LFVKAFGVEGVGMKGWNLWCFCFDDDRNFNWV
jgi:hypothetical protein